MIDATSYDVLLGVIVMCKPTLGVDLYQEIAVYRPNWEKGQYEEIATIPLAIVRDKENVALGVLAATMTMETDDWCEELMSEAKQRETDVMTANLTTWIATMYHLHRGPDK